LLDLAKGAAAVAIGWLWGEPGALAAGGAAILGHMFPVWLGFRGGKGVATALGVLIGIAWPVALGVALVWLLTAVIFHYSSLAALVAAVAAAALAGFVVTHEYIVFAGFIVDHDRAVLIALIAVLVVIRHRDNIHRLLAGTEGRISLHKG
jgi:glycerol-3-phosphate acyltransferase PlsY